MRQSGSTRVGESSRPESLGELVYWAAARSAAGPVFDRLSGEGWDGVSATAFLTEVTGVAKGLIAGGVSSGDRVLVAARSGYEQVVAAWAVWAVRGVVVSVPGGCAPGLLRRVARLTRPAAAVVQTQAQARVMGELQQELVDLGRTFTLESGGVEAAVKTGAYMDGTAVRLRVDECRGDDPALVCFTVTRDRLVRGAVLTHANVLAGVFGVVERLSPAVTGLAAGDASTLVRGGAGGFEPLAVAAACLWSGVRMGFGRAVDHVGFGEDMRRYRPSVPVVGADFLAWLYEWEKGKTKEGGWDGVQMFNAATQLAVDYDKQGKRGARGAWQRMSRAMYEWAYGRLKEALGGRVRVIVCPMGGLEARLTHFYAGAGLPVLEGAGLVQAGGAVAWNVWGAHRPGTVGAPLSGVEVGVSDGGELLVRGPGVFSGYYGDAQESGVALADGWLVSGLLGGVQESGDVVVRERRRAHFAAPRRGPAELERAAPARGAVVARVEGMGVESGEGGVPDFVSLETRLLSHPLISQVIVLAEGRPYVSALITLKREQLEYWRLVNGHPLSTPLSEIAFAPELGVEIRRAVEDVNTSVSAGSAIRAFHVLPEEFSPSSGLLLPSGRLRRDAVLRAFAEEIEALYAGPPSGSGAG
ncbi:AMP-binding protein [Nocardiopsis ansamitocini]|uniref:Long-chain acyl-CoA synthetase n=1 Tax=Nocardiopsis ansamitocini TaxID=1670832 RepID=A0A9W6P6T3_9ACTN|nr:AMP-binding protein [Nocardiopsis ansamitocini]GLU48191.1 long-chain acyl-CoA synthetase [Nocardiopsis ansamitocini]